MAAAAGLVDCLQLAGELEPESGLRLSASGRLRVERGSALASGVEWRDGDLGGCAGD